MAQQLNTLGLAHRFLAEQIKPGAFCIDATAGRGGDTAFLCGLVGPTGRVLAFDIQEDAVRSTRERIEALGYGDVARVVHACHSRMADYAGSGSVDGVVFNFGWLPGGDHHIFTKPETSIAAIQSGLDLLRPGGVMCLCIYAGGASGYEERDALLEFLRGIDHRRYTVLLSQFWNRPNDPPIPVFLWKEA